MAVDAGGDAGTLAKVTPVENCTARWLLDGGSLDAGVIAEAEALVDAVQVSAESNVTSGCIAETASTRDLLDREGRILEHSEQLPDGGIYRAAQFFDGGTLLVFTESSTPQGVHRVEWSYDDAGHLVSKRDGFGNAPPVVTQWTWSDGRVLERKNTDGSGRVWSYDDAGSLTQVDDLDAQRSLIFSRRYGYESDGQVAWVSTFHPDRAFAYYSVSYSYWPSGVLAEEEGRCGNPPWCGDYDRKFDEQGRLVSTLSQGDESASQSTYIYADGGSWVDYRWGVGASSESVQGESRVFSPSADVTVVANVEDGTYFMPQPWLPQLPLGSVDLKITRGGRLALEQTDSDEDCVANQRHVLYRDDAGVLRLERFSPPSPIAERTFHGPDCPEFPSGFGGWNGPAVPPEP